MLPDAIAVRAPANRAAVTLLRGASRTIFSGDISSIAAANLFFAASSCLPCRFFCIAVIFFGGLGAGFRPVIIFRACALKQKHSRNREQESNNERG